MIIERKISVFNSGCDALVNTVNCKGVMGAGLALEFRLRYPDMFSYYQRDCIAGNVKIGDLRTYNQENVLIINFPTKYHWKNPSEYSYISSGLDYMVSHYKEWGVESIAIPPLGCNNGHLDYEIVRKMIFEKLEQMDIEVVICVDPGIPQGREKDMVDAYRSSNLSFICDYLDIAPRIKKQLLLNMDIKRFFDIYGIDGVGYTTYEKLFHTFYKDNVEKYSALEKKMTDYLKGCDIPTLLHSIGVKKIDNKKLSSILGVDSFSQIPDVGALSNAQYMELFESVKRSTLAETSNKPRITRLF